MRSEAGAGAEEDDGPALLGELEDQGLPDADFALGTIWGLRHENGKVTTSGVLFLQPKGVLPMRNVASFGEDANGELFLLVYEGKSDGHIYELEEIKGE